MATPPETEPLFVRVQRRLALATPKPDSDGGTGSPGLLRPTPALSKLSLSDRRHQRLQGPSAGGTEGTGRADGAPQEGKENGWIPPPGRVQVQYISSDDSSEDELPSFCVQGSRGPSHGAHLWGAHIEHGSGADQAAPGAGATAKEARTPTLQQSGAVERAASHRKAAGHGKASPAAVGSKGPCLTGPRLPPPRGCFDSSDDDDEFEAFLLKMKTPLKSKTHLKSVSRALVIGSGTDSDEDFMPAQVKHVRSKRMVPLPLAALGSSRVTDPELNPSPELPVPPLLARGGSLSAGSGTTDPVTLTRPQRESEDFSAVPAPPSNFTQASKIHPTALDEFDDEFESLMDRILKSNSKIPGKNKDKATTPSMTKQGLPSVPVRGRKPPAQPITPQLPAAPRQPPPLPRTNRVKSCPDLELSEPLACIPSQSPASRSTSRCTVPGCFLAELSSPSSHYARNFKQCKVELTTSLYKFYNETIFNKKLPIDMELLWNNKLRKTAGYCLMRNGPAGQPSARIELSIKVCDTPERLRDTLVHEMCHAATWLINGQRDGHGRLWQLYARTAKLVHAELPAVSRCHTYNISFKYRYECTRCKNSVGRHSKSLDTEHFVCALCQGRFVLLPPERPDGTPVASRALTPFARFVKEQYGPTRSAQPGTSHAELMRILGENFAKTKMQ